MLENALKSGYALCEWDFADRLAGVCSSSRPAIFIRSIIYEPVGKSIFVESAAKSAALNSAPESAIAAARAAESSAATHERRGKSRAGKITRAQCRSRRKL